MTNNSFYGLAFNPFDKQSLKVTDSFESTDHKEMMSRLTYLTETKGIGVFTASPGMGKSYTLRCFENTLNKNLFDMKYDGEGEEDTEPLFRAIQDRLFYLYKEKRKPVILAIDEAQYLSAGILKDLKMLMNFNFDSINCFILILCGESALNFTLEKPVHEALKQRITVHYDFQGLDADETAQYIYHKLNRAGGTSTIIDSNAITALAGYSQGNPRLIDNVMTNALLLGSQLQKNTIDSEVIMAAVNEQALTS